MTASMASKSDVAHIKQRLSDPVQLCAALGLTKGAKRQPSGLFILCPNHNERTPSCSVTSVPNGIRIRCFGCGFGGDALSLVALVNGLNVRNDFSSVLERAALIAGVHVDTRIEAINKVPKLYPISDSIFHDIANMILEVGVLDGSSTSIEVCDYLRDRRVLDKAIEDNWGALPDKSSSWKLVRSLVRAFGGDAMAATGLFVCRNGEWMFKSPDNRLLIPWRSKDGKIYTLQRRRLDNGKGKYEIKYVFPKGRPARHVYGIERVNRSQPTAIVEGAVDVLALRSIDSSIGVVGIAGTGCVDHVCELGLFRPIDALDSDNAGAEASSGKTRIDGTRQDGLRDYLFKSGAYSVGKLSPNPYKDWGEKLLDDQPIDE